MNPTSIHIGGRKNICPDDIILLEGDANYTVLYLLNGKKLIVATTLKQLELRFGLCQNFFRPHKSFIVNLDYLADYQVNSNIFTMQNAKKILISRRKKNAFLSKIESN
jgi:DNA-binding LytR/AlgR family response regulator